LKKLQRFNNLGWVLGIQVSLWERKGFLVWYHSEQIPYKRVVKNIFWSYLDFLWSEMCFLGSREAPLPFFKKNNQYLKI
jgi:hypothetical protein